MQTCEVLKLSRWSTNWERAIDSYIHIQGLEELQFVEK